MAKKNLMETAIPDTYSTNMKDAGYIWPAEDTGLVMDSTIIAMARVLSIVKNKNDGSCAVVIRDLKGNFVMAAISKYHAPVEEGQSGNWTLELSFNSDDINDIAVIVDSNSHNFSRTFKNMMWELHHADVTRLEYAYDLSSIAVKSILQYLDANLEKEGDGILEVEVPGIFTASVAIEDGQKVYAIVPSGAVTRIVKDDSGESVTDVAATDKQVAAMFKAA